MTVLSVIQDACQYIGLERPEVVFASDEREHQELAVLVNEAASTIRDAHDWNELVKVHSLAGDGLNEDFTLPGDYNRMLKNTRLYAASAPSIYLRHQMDVTSWLNEKARGFTGPSGSWIIYGGLIRVTPPISSGDSVSFPYISNTIVGPTPKVSFTADADQFLLDERLLKLCLVWLWKMQKQQPYAEEMGSFQDALSVAIGNDKGAKVLRVGTVRLPSAEMAYPYTVGT